MRVTMVKKRFADGSTCGKCEQAEALLRRRGVWDRVDEVVWADEADPASPGMALAREHNVSLAPFFLVDAGGNGGGPRVYTSALQLVRDLQAGGAPAPAPGDGPADPLAEAASLDEDDAPAVVAWALARFGPRCALAFSGAEDVALVDMAVATGLPFAPFVLDTGRLHPETYAFLDRVREHYGVALDVVSPERAPLEALVREKGLFSFYRDGHQECCQIRKVEPLRRALAGRPAWLTGQRRDQSPTRTDVALVELDARNGSAEAPLVKVNPLAAWSQARVWAWIREHRVPFNPLHERGFASIGCAPCTRPVHPGQHPREGRWWWEDETKRECGLHLDLGPAPEPGR